LGVAMDEILFNYETNESLESFEKLFFSLLTATKKEIGETKAFTLSVTYISSENSVEMNNSYRGKDYIADVISFPIDDEHGIYDQLDFRELGDIFICFEEAKRKAEKMNHTIETEMAWLFVHGLLHIIGYDHEQNENDAKIMFDLTDKILMHEKITYEME
jgi:probable rRNA maturation factor